MTVCATATFLFGAAFVVAGCGGRTAGVITGDGSVLDNGCDVRCPCPEHARGELPMRYCIGDFLMECTAELVEGCGWSCTTEDLGECDHRCVDLMDGTALCCPPPELECPERVFEGDGLFCHQGDLYLCEEIEDPFCGVVQQGVFLEFCPYGCGDMTPGYALCCPLLEWLCPEYLHTATGDRFCQGDDLYTCTLACHPDCGCAGQPEFIQTCANGCTDNQDGQAGCDSSP